MAAVTPVPRVRALECPNCGGTVELRGHAHTLTAVCTHCHSVLDTSSPSLQVLHRFGEGYGFDPLIPLGTRGTLEGVEWEAVGFQVRQIVVEGTAYEWSEYLLYNPYRGYRYLTEYQGHWNFIRGLRALPEPATAKGRKAFRFEGKTYAHFQAARAETMFVLGEFPWRVTVGERISVDDYICPPYVLSSETTPDEVVWSSGVYTSGKDIWQAFGLKGSPPQPRGVYANQPSPYSGKVMGLWRTFALLVLAFLAVVVVLGIIGRGTQIFESRYSFNSANKTEPAFVTPGFDLGGGNVEVRVDTDLSNDWAFFAFALINEETGVAYDFGREVSYYYGRDSDGDWTEGRRWGASNVADVPPGRYYLRVEPDMDDDRPHRMNYQVTVKEGVTGWLWLVVAFLLMPLPALFRTVKLAQFENARWAESDYGAPFSSSSSEDDD